MEMGAEVQPVNNDDAPHPSTDIHDLHDESEAENGALEAQESSPIKIKEEDQSAQENGQDGGGQRPSKRRRLDHLNSTRSSSRAISPPWKLAKADGPTTVFEDGKRRSTRGKDSQAETSASPAPKSQRRSTRGSAMKPAYTNGVAKAGIKQNGTRAVSGPRAKVNQPVTRKASASIAPTKSPAVKRSERTRKASIATPTSPELRNGHDPPVVKRGPGRPRQSTLTSTEGFVQPQASTPVSQHQTNFYTPNEIQWSPNDMSSSGPTPRIKLRLRRPEPPNRHVQHAPPSKPFATFGDWLQRDDPLEGEEHLRITAEDASEEADRRLNIVEAVENGVLGQSRCSIYQPEPAEELPQQYGHYDHVVAHALHFQKLLIREGIEHKRLAKRLASEAVERWKEKYKRKTQEEVEQEERDRAVLRYKQLVKDVKDSWGLVKLEIDKERIAKWEEEQLLAGHKAMDSMFNQAQEILGRTMQDSASSFVSDDRDTEVEEEDDSALSGTNEQEVEDENMSSSGSESEGANENDEDANLTQEQLMAKYGQLPDLPAEESSNDEDENSEDDKEQEPIEDEDERTPEPTPDRDLEAQEAVTHVNGIDSVKKPTDNHYAHVNGIQKDSPNESGVDPATIELEQVDEALLDSESGDGKSDSGSEIWSDSDDESEEEEQSGSNSEDEDEDQPNGLWGLLAPDEAKQLNSKPKAISEEAEFDKEAHGTSEVNGHHDQFERTKDVDAHMVNGDAETSPQAETSQGDKQDDRSDVSDMDDIDNNHSEKAILGGRSRHTSSPPRTEIPSLLRGTLREYQHDGLDWLVNLYDSGTNGILADEMGLGKTIQTIALLAYLAVFRKNWGPHLVVVPTSVMLNWEMEFKKWCPGFRIMTYYGDILERQRKRRMWGEDNVIVTSYQLILQDAAAFKRRAWSYLILDEAHNIKNFKTQRWQTLLNFRTESRLLLTGTPLQNNIDELWSLLYFLMPAGFAGEGRIAGLEEFTMALKKPTNQILEQGRQQLDAEAQKVVKKLHEVLRPYLLRRLKMDVEKQMPAKYEHVVYCRLSKRQRQLYDGYMGRADTRATLASGNYMSIINCLMSLRKVCNHPDLFETRQIVTSFAMRRSVAADFEIKDFLIRKRLHEDMEDQEISLPSLGLLLAQRERHSTLHARRTRQIRATRPLEDLIERQTRMLNPDSKLDRASMSSTLKYMEEQEKRAVLDHLKTCLRITNERTDSMPIYGKGLIDRVTVDYQTWKFGTSSNIHRQKNRGKYGFRAPLKPTQASKWFRKTVHPLLALLPTLEERSEALEPIISKFGFVTPAVVAHDLAPLAVSKRGVEEIRESSLVHVRDPFHEPRIRLSIAFPDKNLLQYDCGKLQRLAILLRELQAGGHRALIFTQMTKVLDILEQFLNIHGHLYLRLDGATKVEQRQILTDRFNSDPRILCFILSSRSGGLGINLTGADSVIFYDLDWNPAMDKQCQDRSHRIGQTRDVHIYKFVSEYTIEANILRKSNQKRLLDDVIIQKGDFTTDYFNKVTWRDAFDDVPVDEAGAAMDRVLGDASGLNDVIQSVEDTEDAIAAKAAQKEIREEIHDDAEDFKENISASATPHGAQSRARSETTGDELVKREHRHVDEYMLDNYRREYLHEPWRPPEKAKKKSKKGMDPHQRPTRKRTRL